jgi:hypothetical protein
MRGDCRLDTYKDYIGGNMPGWGDFFGGIGKILDKLPIQGRRERWRNEIEKLTKEKNGLLNAAATVERAKRLTAIDSRLDYLNGLFRNAERD